MNFPAKLTKLTSKAQVVLTKHSPEIWLGAGIVAIVGGTIWACKATRKLDGILEEHEAAKDDLKYDRDEDIEEERSEEGPETEIAVAVIEKEYKKDCAKLYVTTGAEIAREYLPAVLLIGGGIVMIVNGHRILCKRNGMLLAAYGTLEQSFNDYRERVKTRFGEEVEDEIYTGTTYIETTKTEIGEDGKKHKVKEKVPVIGESLSRYARFYDEANSTEWTRAPDYNRTFIICQQNQANDRLRRKGYLFLNEVYRMLGMSETPTGAICGWLMPEDFDPLAEGDPFVEFKIVDGTNRLDIQQMDMCNPSVLLDFNCQGIIYDKI